MIAEVEFEVCTRLGGIDLEVIVYTGLDDGEVLVFFVDLDGRWWQWMVPPHVVLGVRLADRLVTLEAIAADQVDHVLLL